MSEPLRPVDAARILMRASAIDNRDPSAAADEVWASALNTAGLTLTDYEDCLAAVDRHYADTSDRIMPSHVAAIVREVRKVRALADRETQRRTLEAARPSGAEAKAVLGRLRALTQRASAAHRGFMAQAETRPCRWTNTIGGQGSLASCPGTIVFEPEAGQGTCDTCGAGEGRFAPGYTMAERGFDPHAVPEASAGE